MKAFAALPLLATLLLAVSATAQQATASPSADACGPNKANYDVQHDAGPFVPQQVPSEKALVYIIEAMPHYPFVTEKVNIGLDGTWLGATDAQTYMSFTIDPGVHHLCAVYQGHAEGMDEEGRTLLLHLDAQAGKIYYIRYHALFLKDSPGIAFFEKVDDDEGLFLLQRAHHATSTLKK
jgi:hypothetical protein